MTNPRIAIIGGGFAGAYCAQALENTQGTRLTDRMLIDRNNYFVFYPLLIEAGTGSLEPRHAVVPLRSFLRRTTFRMAEVETVDLATRSIRCRMTGDGHVAEIGYDHLVLALGAVTHLPDIPGLKQHGYELKSLADAVALRDHAIRMLEAADAADNSDDRRMLLHFVIVGGSFTGVELAGELEAFLGRAHRAYRNIQKKDWRVTLIERDERILPALDVGLAGFATANLRGRGIDVRLKCSLSEASEDRMQLDSGETLRAKTVVWCAGIAPSPLIDRLDVPTDERGYIVCERDLRVRGHDNAWAVGDCAVNPDADGKAYPATAQHAVREGVHLAANLNRVIRGRSPKPCDIKTRGALAALGCRSGVAKLFGIQLSGFAAWFAYRTVYLLKMPGLSRKLRVAVDWTMDLLFPAEPVQLNVHRVAEKRSEQEP